MRLGRWLEALFRMGTASVKNRQAIQDLSVQVSVFANSTPDSSELLKEQLQHTSKRTAQHRALLDLMLLKEQGVCGMLNLAADDCCISIPTVSAPLRTQTDKMRKVAKDSEAIAAA